MSGELTYFDGYLARLDSVRARLRAGPFGAKEATAADEMRDAAQALHVVVDEFRGLMPEQTIALLEAVMHRLYSQDRMGEHDRTMAACALERVAAELRRAAGEGDVQNKEEHA